MIVNEARSKLWSLPSAGSSPESACPRVPKRSRSEECETDTQAHAADSMPGKRSRYHVEDKSAAVQEARFVKNGNNEDKKMDTKRTGEDARCGKTSGDDIPDDSQVSSRRGLQIL